MAAFYYSYSESDPPPALAGLGKSSPCLESVLAGLAGGVVPPPALAGLGKSSPCLESVLATGVVPPLAPLLPTPPKEQTHEPQRAT